MPRDERYPTPLLNMNPAGLPGLLAVAAMFIGIWSLFGPYFVLGFALMSVIAVALALVIRSRRTKHQNRETLLHLDPESKRNGDG